jgi:outer membrane protein
MKPGLIAALILIPGTVLGGERLSIRDAMARAREHAGEVIASESRAKAARERVRQARGFLLPAVTVQELWIRTDSPAEAFAMKMNQERFSFPEFMTSDPNQPDPLSTAISRVEVTMPLFTGGELSGRIRQAELVAEAAEQQAEWLAEAAALAAAEAYVVLDRAKEYVELLKRARATVAAHVALAEAYVEQGMLVRSELLRAKVELARLDDVLAETEGHVRTASALLAFRVGAPAGTEWNLDLLDTPGALTVTLDELLGSSSARLDLSAARAVLRAGEIEESVRRAAYWPRVGLVGRSDWVDDRLFGGHGRSTAIVALASLNVFAGGSDRAAAASARWEAKAGLEDVARFEEGVRLEVRQAYEDATTATRRHNTARRAVALAEEGARITEERFRSGVVKMIDVLDAATALREAEARELTARADARLAVIRLAIRSGRQPHETAN